MSRINDSQIRACVLFDNIGPYHIARLNAAAETLNVYAVEIASESLEYAWRRNSETAKFDIQSLFDVSQRNSLNFSTIVKRLAQVIEDRPVDVIVIPGWSSRLAVAGAAVALKRALPIVVMSESSAFDQRRLKVREWCKTQYLKLCGAALVGGTSHKEYLQALGMNPASVFFGYDAVDNSHFSPNKQRSAWESTNSAIVSTPYFLASSRFVAKKNLSRLIRAYSDYCTRAVEAQLPVICDLVLLGDGPLASALKEEISVLNLDTKIHLPGFKQYDELPHYYSNAVAFVHVSTVEQWGLVVNEAMAAGCPIVASKQCGCVNELVSHGENGFVVDAHSQDAIASALMKISALTTAERSHFGAVSIETVSKWGPARFAEGLYDACKTAKKSPPSASLFNRTFLRAMGTLCK